MPRELGEKSAAILAALQESTVCMTADELAEAVGDIEPGAALRVRALLKSMAGKGLVHTVARDQWDAGPTSHATEGQPQPVHDEPEPVPTRAEMMTTTHRQRFDLIAAIVRAGHVEIVVDQASRGPSDPTRISLELYP